jgi:hypothetical protein
MALSDIVQWPTSIPYFGDRILAPTNTYNQKFKIIDDQVQEIHNIVVHRFNLSDVEDPDLWAAEPILNWQNSEVGKWVMEHALEIPIWHRHVRSETYSFEYAITAKLTGKDYTFWCLKWQGNVDKYPK